MNKVILIGRLTRDPDIRYTQGENCIARYTLAVDRKKDETDFISIVAFGKSGEFAEKYLRKGTKIAIEGRIQTGSYTKDGAKVYTTEVVAEKHEFVESKIPNKNNNIQNENNMDGFMNIPDGLPFN